MPNKELKAVLDYMEREKGLDRDLLVETIKSSLQSAARKSVKEIANPIIEINPETMDVTVYGNFLVIEDGSDPKSSEVSLSKASKTDPNVQIGSYIMIEVTPKNFGRIAAQTAKQVIIQKLRNAEADVVFNEYKDRINQIVTGTVRRKEGKNVVLDLDRGEALLKPKEQIENEEYHIGDRLKVLLLDVKRTAQTPDLVVSRSHPNFIKKLFEIEVPEISDKTVEIMGIAREPGYRTKIAVYSKDPKVDSVGACVGMRGSRVKNIVQELNGEKIDIVPWSQDTATFCRNAMNPAKLKHINVDEKNRKIQVFVDKTQFSLAIGKKGHNARLTSKLLGWKIDIEVTEKEIPAAISASPKKQPVVPEEAVDNKLEIPIQEMEGLSKKVKEYFLEAGYKTLEDLQKINPDELYTIPGVGKSSAEEIMEIIRDTIKQHLK